ncbi:hypothetical protein BDB00DRAFT_830887 [Zychaea mexicana]|uniref:uncharacterized protein n=1 Tax=Zychaea mexicana TaxID=64656 RepID=UPI0022FE067D|nr:uncharacterized protein BDB00DRAFT_830887 [Zychaea mexicana]KAI9491851.1 hypothetical protein BDB00DRAFT_830887 [Zychaea mexicana]
MDSEVESVINNTIEGLNHELRQISLQIHDNPELGNREYKAHKLLTDYLDKQGFKVQCETAGLETAFIAEFSNGPGRRVGFCAEYDALPGVGHACGHNLISISGVACAMATKTLLEKNLIQGTVVLFGTPAEESTSGKIDLVTHGEVQKRVDFAMMLHPFANDCLYALMLALDSVVVEYFGKASHAGMAPWNGINAVDALMQGWNNMAMLRQQTLTTNRLHGIILNGGKSANVIPDYASAKFYARSVTRNQLTELKAKLEHCFEAAAKATGCKMKVTWASKGVVEDVFTNDAMILEYKKYMEQEGIDFPSRAEEERTTTGSTDFGNISNVVPAIHPGFGIHTTASNHTKEFTEAAGTEEAHADAIRAARCLAKTAATVFLDDALYERAVADFKKGKPQ